MNSTEAYRAVAAREIDADRAVDLLLESGGLDDVGKTISCPECGAAFEPSVTRHLNTCSIACTSARNTAIFALDGGRSIVMIRDLTPDRAAEMLREAGINVGDEHKPVVPS